MEYDLALTKRSSKGFPAIQIVLPMPLSRALIDRGYNRGTLTVTDEGITIRPYVGAQKLMATADLPEWDKS